MVGFKLLRIWSLCILVSNILCDHHIHQSPAVAGMYRRSAYPNISSVADSYWRKVPRRSYGTWGTWSSWSSCSRTCGRGVSTQTRECVDHHRRTRRSRRDRCLGISKRFQLCNEKPCLYETDMRREQCATYNRRSLDGKYYNWEPYILDPEDCQLRCRPQGQKFYATLANVVEDGTSCSASPFEVKVCISGTCKVVGCDGVIGSHLRRDRCGVCGGDNSTCKLVSGLFTMSVMPVGYNVIAKVPAGACTINITELRPTKNFLALRTSDGKYVINGDWAISWPGSYSAAGTVFNYQRSDPPLGESITAAGPTDKPVDILIIYQSPNPGIRYEYTIRNSNNITALVQKTPQTAQPALDSWHRVRNLNRHDTRYHMNGHSPVYRSNHHRHQTTSARPELHQPQQDYPKTSPSVYRTPQGDNGLYHNQRHPTTQGVTRRTDATGDSSRHYEVNSYGNKSGRLSPSEGSRRKNRGPRIRNGNHKTRWKATGLTECSRSCGGGIQKTIVSCVKEHSLIKLPDHRCSHLTRIEAKVTECNTHPCPPSWEAGEWSQCSATCGEGFQRRDVICRQTQSATVHLNVHDNACVGVEKPSTARTCSLRPCVRWSAGAWGKCSAECGKGMRKREVKCVVDSTGLAVLESTCKDKKLEHEEMCDMGPCSSTWLTSRWSDTCSNPCGPGVQKRRVVCVSSDKTSCRQDQKPLSESRCPVSSPCIGRWFIGPWSECSSSCGNGTQTRDVICLRLENEQWRVVPESNCPLAERPSLKQICSRGACLPEWFTSEWGECSKTCGSGVQSREVTCLDASDRISQDCKEDSKPISRQACSVHQCPAKATVAAEAAPAGQADEGCRNSLAQCPIVVQARLCSYVYYQNACCLSCRNAS